MLAYKDGRRVRLISRNAVDHTMLFRELAAAIAKLRADVLVLDGEVRCSTRTLVSRFHLLRDQDTETCPPGRSTTCVTPGSRMALQVGT